MGLADLLPSPSFPMATKTSTPLLWAYSTADLILSSDQQPPMDRLMILAPLSAAYRTPWADSPIAPKAMGVPMLVRMGMTLAPGARPCGPPAEPSPTIAAVMVVPCPTKSSCGGYC